MSTDDIIQRRMQHTGETLEEATLAVAAISAPVDPADQKLWWLSFCDPELPAGRQFLGACIVPGGHVADAAREARARGCNPGGEVKGHEIPEDSAKLIDDGWKGKLLTRTQCQELNEAVAARRTA